MQSDVDLPQIANCFDAYHTLFWCFLACEMRHVAMCFDANGMIGWQKCPDDCPWMSAKLAFILLSFFYKVLSEEAVFWRLFFTKQVWFSGMIEALCWEMQSLLGFRDIIFIVLHRSRQVRFTGWPHRRIVIYSAAWVCVGKYGYAMRCRRIQCCNRERLM